MQAYVMTLRQWHLWPCCRYIQNGFDISTEPPSVGKGVQLKQLIMQSATRVTGACVARLPRCNRLCICMQDNKAKEGPHIPALAERVKFALRVANAVTSTACSHTCLQAPQSGAAC